MQQLCETKDCPQYCLNDMPYNTSMDHLHLKGNIYHGEGETGEQSSPLHIGTVSCVSVCAAHQQCLLYIHRGIWWGTIHAPWSFL